MWFLPKELGDTTFTVKPQKDSSHCDPKIKTFNLPSTFPSTTYVPIKVSNWRIFLDVVLVILRGGMLVLRVVCYGWICIVLQIIAWLCIIPCALLVGLGYCLQFAIDELRTYADYFEEHLLP